MTIVGPRPERPEIAEEYEKVMPEFRLRLQARLTIKSPLTVSILHGKWIFFTGFFEKIHDIR